MTMLLLIIVVGLVIWLVALSSNHKELRQAVFKAAEEAKAYEKNYEINQNLAAILTVQLIRQHGAKKAALVYFRMLENSPARDSVPILRNLYKQAGLPEEWGDYMHMVTVGGWSDEKYKENEAKNKRIVLRTLATHFANIEDDIKAEDARMSEVLTPVA